MSARLRVYSGVLALCVQLVVRPASSATVLDNGTVETTNRPASASAVADQHQTLVIVKALYGIPGQQIDVTEKVRGMVQENAIDLRGHYEQVFGDPAPGVYKSLIITYSLGGKERTVVASDYGVLHVPLPEQQSKLVIVEATYGAKKVFLDVKDTLQGMVEGDRIMLTRPLHQVFGDPLPGVPKTLNVKYRYNQLSNKMVTFKDGVTVKIP